LNFFNAKWENLALLLAKSWDYVDSVYYTVITLLTIGFGDMVAGAAENCFLQFTCFLLSLTCFLRRKFLTFFHIASILCVLFSL
jgi:hypothetical protein